MGLSREDAERIAEPFRGLEATEDGDLADFLVSWFYDEGEWSLPVTLKGFKEIGDRIRTLTELAQQGALSADLPIDPNTGGIRS